MPDKPEDTSGDQALPPIPDGGLSNSMPEWLRRPPAWRTLRDADVVQTRPEVSRELPEADTSEIDPRSLLTDDDLPAWLRNLGRRQRPVMDQADQRLQAADADGDERGLFDLPETDTTAGQPSAASTNAARFVPRRPAIQSEPDTPTAPHHDFDQTSTQQPIPAPANSPWWQGLPMVLILGALLAIAVVVIVLMAVV